MRRTLVGVHRHVLAWGLALSSVAVVGCKGDAPTLTAVEGKRVVAVGETLVIVLYGNDADGRSVEYGFSSDTPDLAASATMAKRPDQSGLFTWTPRASHVGQWSFVFRASNGRNETKLSIPIEVRGAVGEGTQPIFRQPLGHGVVLPLATHDCIELDILVDDQDSRSITLTQEPPLIPGATLEADDNGLRGTWKWCPRKDSGAGMSTHRLRLAADDGDNPKVHKDFTIAVRKRSVSASMACPGTPPVVEHQAKDFHTVRDLEITAAIRDDLGLASSPLLLYSTEAPGDPVDASTMQMVQMQRLSGSNKDGSWRAVIPNPLASSDADESQNIYYSFTVADDDDPDGDACDHVIDSPSRGTHRISVTRPGDTGTAEAKEAGLGPCEPCSGDLQCGSPHDLCIRPSTGGDAYCSIACDGEQCPAGYACTSAEVESVDGMRAQQCVPEFGQCSAGPDESLSCASDASHRSLESALPLSPGDQPLETMCPESGKLVRHWYSIDIDEPMLLHASVTTADGLDLQLGLVNDKGLQLAQSTWLEVLETLSYCLMPGTHYLSVSGRPELAGDAYLLAQELEKSDSCTVESECCDAKATPGCADQGVEACVCAADAFCCDVAWDTQCVAEVQLLGCGDCDLGAGDCCEPGFFPGCNDPYIEDCVCFEDPLCCDLGNGWDMLCVLEVELLGCGSCGFFGDGHDCCQAGEAPGCGDPFVESCVCAEDPFCCDPQQSWDALCASQVESFGCGTCGGNTPPEYDCCEDHGMLGCDDPYVESCVCHEDPFCCTTQWDALCVSHVDAYGCGTCAQALCSDTCQFANDGWCDDGGPGADFSVCPLGTDCSDCGPRTL